MEYHSFIFIEQFECLMAKCGINRLCVCVCISGWRNHFMVMIIKVVNMWFTP